MAGRKVVSGSVVGATVVEVVDVVGAVVVDVDTTPPVEPVGAAWLNGLRLVPEPVGPHDTTGGSVDDGLSINRS